MKRLQGASPRTMCQLWQSLENFAYPTFPRRRRATAFTKGEITRMRITLQFEDFIRAITTIWYTCPYRSRKPRKFHQPMTSSRSEGNGRKSKGATPSGMVSKSLYGATRNNSHRELKQTKRVRLNGSNVPSAINLETDSLIGSGTLLLRMKCRHRVRVPRVRIAKNNESRKILLRSRKI